MSQAIHSTAPAAALAARALIASLFIVSVAGKLAAPTAAIGYITSFGLPFPLMAYASAVGVELLGGALLMVGLWTRATSLLLAAFTVVAGLVFHSDLSSQNEFVHLLKNLAVAGGLLQLATAGAGPWSLDARWSNRSRQTMGVARSSSLA